MGTAEGRSHKGDAWVKTVRFSRFDVLGIQLLIIAALLALPEVLVDTGLVSPFALAPTSEIALSLIKLIQDGAIWQPLLETLLLVVVCFVLVAVVGTIVGLAFWLYSLARRSFATVFWLRLVVWMPPWLHAFFGLSSVSFATHFWASLLGYVLPLFLVSYFGERLFDRMRQAPLSLWVGLGAGLVAAALLVWMWRRCRSAHACTADQLPAA